MGILIPIILPLAGAFAAGGEGIILYAATGSVLAGATLGDHMSPLSDTTVLSAAGAGVDVVSHTRTQLPYACTVGTVALLVGYLPVGLGIPPLGIDSLRSGHLCAGHSDSWVGPFPSDLKQFWDYPRRRKREIQEVTRKTTKGNDEPPMDTNKRIDALFHSRTIRTPGRGRG